MIKFLGAGVVLGLAAGMILVWLTEDDLGRWDGYR
jgi:hypothetical protein